jgi:hypothetical protein
LLAVLAWLSAAQRQHWQQQLLLLLPLPSTLQRTRLLLLSSSSSSRGLSQGQLLGMRVLTVQQQQQVGLRWGFTREQLLSSS